MQIGSNIHTLSQPTKITPSTLEHNTISSTKLESKKINDLSSLIFVHLKKMKQPEHKFNELDLWKMLRIKVFLYGLYLKCYKRLVKKEAQNNSVQNSNAIEETSETRLNEVM